MKHELYNSGYRQHLFTTKTKCASAAGQNHLFGISFAIVIRQEFICSFDSVHIESPSEGLLDR